MELTRHRERIECASYTLGFYWKAQPGAGFGFPCDAQGKLYPFSCDAAAENYAYCLAHPEELTAAGLQEAHWSYMQPAEGPCDDCGRTVELDGFTNTCDCGADYNSSGQRLAPRSQWGEETGETAADCLSPPELE